MVFVNLFLDQKPSETRNPQTEIGIGRWRMGAETNGVAEKVDDLLEAARYNDIDDLRTLASDGLSLHSRDSQGRTALHMAAANGHMTIVEYLISEGVDINALNDENNAPLHWACLNGHVEVVKRLILAGASLSLLNRFVS
jgi:ankyrin repeat protein